MTFCLDFCISFCYCIPTSQFLGISLDCSLFARCWLVICWHGYSFYLLVRYFLKRLIRAVTNILIPTFEICSYFANKYMKHYTPHGVEQEVEWLYAFDVHCNSFFCSFLITYVLQVCFLGLSANMNASYSMVLFFLV